LPATQAHLLQRAHGIVLHAARQGSLRDSALTAALQDLFSNLRKHNFHKAEGFGFPPFLFIKKCFHATFPDANLYIGHKANCRNIWRIET